MKAAILATW